MRAWRGAARWWLFFALVSMSAVAMVAPPAVAQAAPARTSLPVIEREVMCTVCKIPLNIAQSPEADRERAFIQGRIDQGQTQIQIKRALVAQYGPSVLATPSAHGFGLVAYVVPLGGVLLALALLAMVLPRWHRRARQAPQSVAPLSAEERARLDADLARLHP